MKQTKGTVLKWDITPYDNQDLLINRLDNKTNIELTIHNELLNNLFWKVRALNGINKINYPDMSDSELLTEKQKWEKNVLETLNKITAIPNQVGYLRDLTKPAICCLIKKDGEWMIKPFCYNVADPEEFDKVCRKYDFNDFVIREFDNQMHDRLVEELMDELNSCGYLTDDEFKNKDIKEIIDTALGNKEDKFSEINDEIYLVNECDSYFGMWPIKEINKYIDEPKELLDEFNEFLKTKNNTQRKVK